MREYMKNLGTVMMMISISQMLIPEGGLKKFAALAAGFILITTAVSVIPQSVRELRIPESSVVFEGIDMETAQKTYRAEVLRKHKENLEGKISENFSGDSRVSVEIDPEGNITGVTLAASTDESRAVSYIVNTLKVPRERIMIINEKN